METYVVDRRNGTVVQMTLCKFHAKMLAGEYRWKVRHSKGIPDNECTICGRINRIIKHLQEEYD